MKLAQALSLSANQAMQITYKMCVCTFCQVLGLDNVFSFQNTNLKWWKDPPCSADSAKATAVESEGWHVPWDQSEHMWWHLCKELLGELVQVLHYLLNQKQHHAPFPPALCLPATETSFHKLHFSAFDIFAVFCIFLSCKTVSFAHSIRVSGSASEGSRT